MFLFTTPASPTAQPGATAPATGPAAGPVVDAIRRGAEQTGTDFAYLLNTAKRESSLDPAAKAPTSSASGLFQFIEQTWLGLVKSEGPKLGLSDLAGAIAPKADGGYAVQDANARQAILKLREDPSLSSLMAGTLTQQNREALQASTGRAPSSGELYMAHLLGSRGATDLIRTAAADPSRPAAADMPEAAAANRALFYDRAGKPRSAAELYGVLSTGAVAQPAPVTAAGATRPVTVTGTEPPLPKLTGPALYGLFQTSERTGPVSGAVAKLWRVNTANASATPAAPFFPRADGSVPAAGSAETAPAEVAPVPVPAAAASGDPGVPASGPTDVPLPPPRPRRFAAAAGTRSR